MALGACMQECDACNETVFDICMHCVRCMHGITVLMCTGCVRLADCLLRVPACTWETQQGQCRAQAHVVRVRSFFSRQCAEVLGCNSDSSPSALRFGRV
jgi:hypothetical protein